jgi:hypothetical protein
MSNSVLIAMGIYALLLAPLLLVYLKPATTLPVALLYGAPLIAAAVYYGGPLLGGPVAQMPVGANGVAGGITPRQCEEVLGLLRRERIVLSERDPAHPVVAAAMWNALPEEVRNVVITCFEAGRRGDATTPVEVVLQ